MYEPRDVVQIALVNGTREKPDMTTAPAASCGGVSMSSASMSTRERITARTFARDSRVPSLMIRSWRRLICLDKRAKPAKVAMSSGVAAGSSPRGFLANGRFSQ